MEICYNAAEDWQDALPFAIESVDGVVSGVIENGIAWEVKPWKANYVPFIIYKAAQPGNGDAKYKMWGPEERQLYVHTKCTMQAKHNARLHDLPEKIAREMLGLLQWGLWNSESRQSDKWTKKLKMSIGQLQSLLDVRDAEPLARRLDFVCGSVWLDVAPSLPDLIGVSFAAWCSDPPLSPPVMFKPDHIVRPVDGLRMLTRRFRDTVVGDIAAGECACCFQATCLEGNLFLTHSPPATALKHRVVLIVKKTDATETLGKRPRLLFRALWLKGDLRWVSMSSADNAKLVLEGVKGNQEVWSREDTAYIFVLSLAHVAFFTWKCLQSRAQEVLHSSVMAAALGGPLDSKPPHFQLDVLARLKSLPDSWGPFQDQADALRVLMSHRSPVKVVQAGPGTGKSEVLAFLLWGIMQGPLKEAKCVVISPKNKLADELADLLELRLGEVVLRMGGDHMERAIQKAAERGDSDAAERLQCIEQQLHRDYYSISKPECFDLLSEHMGLCYVLHVAGRTAAKEDVRAKNRVFVGTKDWFLKYMAKLTSGPRLITDVHCLCIDEADECSMAELAAMLGVDVQMLFVLGCELRCEPEGQSVSLIELRSAPKVSHQEYRTRHAATSKENTIVVYSQNRTMAAKATFINDLRRIDHRVCHGATRTQPLKKTQLYPGC
jgi:hypothetical protein